MNSNGLMLYKLIILYMLDRVDFPLTNAQLSQFIIDKGYTTYFNLQESINQLITDGFISSTTIRNTSHYQSTPKGREALAFFENKLSEGIKQDILSFFNAEKINLKNEVELLADYYPTSRGEYTVICTINDRGDTVLELKMNVPSKDQAIAICDAWPEKSTSTYQYLLKNLWFEESKP